jgi:5-formyltetrahydrofolate cyclo-ligase
VNAGELKRKKQRVRARVLAVRDAMSTPARAAAGRAIVERVLSLPELSATKTVMVFWSFGSEVETAPLRLRLHDAGVRVALPRIVERELEARAYVPGDPVTVTSFGAAEPSDGEVVAPEEVDVVLTPGVAFDRRGMRVGYGGGYYDRFLARTRDDAVRMGLGFAVQLVEDPLPAGSFDLRLDLLVTEAEVLRFER